MMKNTQRKRHFKTNSSTQNRIRIIKCINNIIIYYNIKRVPTQSNDQVDNN